MEASSGIAASVLVQYAVQGPLFLVWIAGIIISVVNWGRYPRVAMLTAIVCAALLVESLIMTYVTVALPYFLMQSGGSASQIGAVFSVIGVGRAVVNAVLWGLLLLAMFKWRGAQPQAGQDDRMHPKF